MNKPIRVVHVVNDVLVGGAQIVALGVAQYIDKTRFTPAIFSLQSYSDRVNLREKIESHHIEFVDGIFEKGRPALLYNVIRLREFIQSTAVDVMHCHLPDAVLVGGVASILTGVPFIIHEHQTHQFHSWKIRLAYKFLRYFAATTICYTDSVESELFGTVHRKVPAKGVPHSLTIFNGVDTQGVAQAKRCVVAEEKRKSLGLPPEAVVIFSAARFVKWKGHLLLIEAFAKIAQTIPNAQLVIAGEGPERAQAVAYVASQNLEHRVHLLGARTDVYELLAISDIFSLAFDYPSGMDAEAIGVAGFEGMAAGLPVIIGGYVSANTFIGSNNERGIVVRPRDASVLAEALTKLCQDKEYRVLLGWNAQRFVEEHLSWSSQVKTYEEIYGRLVA